MFLQARIPQPDSCKVLSAALWISLSSDPYIVSSGCDASYKSRRHQVRNLLRREPQDSQGTINTKMDGAWKKTKLAKHRLQRCSREMLREYQQQGHSMHH